jgi:hypothetical protein
VGILDLRGRSSVLVGNLILLALVLLVLPEAQGSYNKENDRYKDAYNPLLSSAAAGKALQTLLLPLTRTSAGGSAWVGSVLSFHRLRQENLVSSPY